MKNGPQCGPFRFHTLVATLMAALPPLGCQ